MDQVVAFFYFVFWFALRKDLVIQRWAETVSCCGVDWGCVPELWNRVVLRKWLNIGSGLGDSDFSADECGTSDGETDREGRLPSPLLICSHPEFIVLKLF